MKRLLLALIALPGWSQWATYDAANWGINSRNLQQTIQSYQKFQEYRQIYENASAFLHNPAAFLAAAANVMSASEVVLQQSGSPSAARVAQLQKIMGMGRVAMSEAQTIQAMSHGNSAMVGQMAIQMAQTAEQLAQAQTLVEKENRTAYYIGRDRYQPQSEAIASWRLK